jgi:hypothetical protein
MDGADFEYFQEGRMRWREIQNDDMLVSFSDAELRGGI